jgi:hypothetical protein
MKTYYKIVKPDLKSIIINDKRLTTQYKIGEYVSSPIPETPLAVFSRIGDVRGFIISQLAPRPYRVFECKIKTKLKIAWLPTLSNIDRILKLIKNKKKYLRYSLMKSYIPWGTVCCKQVMLTKEIRI